MIVVNSTSSCPSTAEKWNARAEKVNCESMLSTVNDTLKYHCLVNHWGNKSVEVCGEESEIIGKYIFLIYFINITYIFSQNSNYLKHNPVFYMFVCHT